MSGDWFVYRVQVTNSGLNTVTGVTVFDSLPAQIYPFNIINNGYTAIGYTPTTVSGYIASLVQ
jgi:uncharacterized repeat protein (TIGR01451 family)